MVNLGFFLDSVTGMCSKSLDLEVFVYTEHLHYP